MISEGSCDTEDWSNDVENSALHHRNTILKLFHNITVLQYFWLNKCSLGEQKKTQAFNISVFSKLCEFTF